MENRRSSELFHWTILVKPLSNQPFPPCPTWPDMLLNDFEFLLNCGMFSISAHALVPLNIKRNDQRCSQGHNNETDSCSIVGDDPPWSYNWNVQDEELVWKNDRLPMRWNAQRYGYYFSIAMETCCCLLLRERKWISISM